MNQRFHDQIFQRMSFERRVRRFSVMNALAYESLKANNNKENDKSINNDMDLPFNVIHSTPLKNQQITDNDVLEPPSDFTLGASTADEETREMNEPLLVVAKLYELKSDNESFFHESPESKKNKFVNEESDTPREEDITGITSHKNGSQRIISDLNKTAEYEFTKKLEISKQFLSTSSLLEEIEADLPSSYSLARPLSHTLHTLSSYRTIKRLARVDGNLICPVNSEQKDNLDGTVLSKTKDYLETQVVVQKALAKQAEKALILSKAQKFLEVEHVESEKSLLLANLRLNAAVQELEKLKMLGSTQEKENFGEIIITDVWFTPLEIANEELGKLICVATEKENVQCSNITSTVIDGNIHFDQPFVFSNLRKDFIIYIELFRLYLKEEKKTALANSLIKRFKKIATVNLNKSLMDSTNQNSGFTCVASAELRINQIKNRTNGKCIITFSESPKFPVSHAPVSLQLKTDLTIILTQQSFLNVFHQTWHRRWYSQSGFYLNSWLYPEHEESGQAPLDSINLKTSVAEVKIAGLEVCIRPNSFLIVMKKSKESILFSADSQKDMIKWISRLNLTIEEIRLWNPSF